MFLVTLVSVSALGWFGWKLLDQERVVESQRDRERLEQAAERIAAIARGALAETGERLGTWLITPPPEGKPDEGLLLLLSSYRAPATFRPLPAHRLLYRPSNPAPPEARTAYLDLANAGSQARVADVPAELIAHALCELSGEKTDAQALQQDLLRSRWQLTRGQFAYYWSESARLSGNPGGWNSKRTIRSLPSG